MKTARMTMDPCQDAAPPPRLCEHPGCDAAGEFRAPRSRDRLTDYYWFCLEHVRDYNKSWNYYAGLSEAEVERMIRQDTVWQRPTWPMGSWRIDDVRLRSHLYRSYGLGEDVAGTRERRPAWQPRTEQEKALAELGLEPPADFAAIKARYKLLVKLHHPYANGGAREAEEKLKTINHAYGVLKAHLAA